VIMGGIDPAILIASLMAASVPILLAALGELVVEKAGVLNLGVEGMMIMGAIVGFMVTIHTESPVLGFVCGALGGAAISLVFAFLTQVLLANQVATGLALTLFGLGLSALLGQGYNGLKPVQTEAVPLGPLADIPFFGQVLFSHDWIVYFSIFMTAAIWYVLKSTRLGLIIRAVGESHEAAHALVPQWVDGITSGAGWIALAIVVFASWKPWRAMIGAYLFGGITVLQLNLQAAGSWIPVEYLSMSPYLITIVVLVIMSSGKGKASLNAPAALGQNFHASR